MYLLRLLLFDNLFVTELLCLMISLLTDLITLFNVFFNTKCFDYPDDLFKNNQFDKSL